MYIMFKFIYIELLAGVTAVRSALAVYSTDEFG